jgi:uncharacterized protein YbjQ (UPF0145 family)
MANQIDKNFVTTGNDFQGYRIVKYLGLVKSYGEKTFMIKKDFAGKWDEHYAELILSAEEAGANAILSLRFELAIMDDLSAASFVFYGTAVVIEPVTA